MNKEAFALEAVSAAEAADTLRLLTCGSVDDGKSTLIGRLLYDSHLLMEDQLDDLKADSQKHGTAGDAIDFALLVDGLEAEREQGITIDVAYRFFATPRRRFIVADTPGHVQYTRNMATGASTADLAVLLVDASKGLLTQTRRHAVIVSLLGIRDVVLAVNKMDLVGFDEARFREIAAAFEAFSADLAFQSITAIPISARDGDNVTTPSARTPYYSGPSAASNILRRVASGPARRGRPLPHAGPVGLPTEPGFPRLRRAGSLRQGRRRRRGRGRRVGPQEPRRPPSCRRRRAGERGRRAIGHADACRRGRHQPRRHALAPPTAARRSPTSSPPISCGWTRSTCSPAANIS